MSEFFLALSNLLFGVSILGYFYFREIKNKDREFDRFQQLILIQEDMAQTSLKTLTDIATSKDKLFQQALLEYLKHNERLEKMILPHPVTRKAVQDILDQTPPMVPNEIDKTDGELEQKNLDELISKIPFGKNTKVAFEGEEGSDLDEEIIPDMMNGQIA